MTGRYTPGHTRSIRKYSRPQGNGNTSAISHLQRVTTATCTTCAAVLDEPVGKRRREAPERVERRPDPKAWSDDELIGLHEAAALLWPEGPLGVSSLRTAVAKGDLACVRIAGRIYTTLAALAAMSACRSSPAGDGKAASKGLDWDAYLKTLLPAGGTGEG